MECGECRIQFGFHAPCGDPLGDEIAALRSGKGREDFAVSAFNARYIGEKNEGIGLKPNGASDGHLVRVDIENFALAIGGDAGNDGQVSVSGEDVQEASVGADGFADLAKRRVEEFGFGEERVDAGETDGFGSGFHEGGDEFVVDRAGEHFEEGIDHFGSGDAESVNELGFDAAFGQKSGHLFAAAVDDRELMLAAEIREFGGEAIAGFRFVKQRAAEFDEQFHEVRGVRQFRAGRA